MAQKQFAGLPPLSHFTYDGKEGGSVGFFTQERSLMPALITVSQCTVELDDKANPPEGLMEELSKDVPNVPALVNLNGDKFFPSNRTALDLSHRYAVTGTDLCQSSTTVSSYDWPHRIGLMDYKVYKDTRLVFYAHHMCFLSKGPNVLGTADFHAYQPFRHSFVDGTLLYAYLPIGRHTCAYFVVAPEQGDTKVLSLDLAVASKSFAFTNHWFFSVAETEGCDPSTYANLRMTNVCIGNGGDLQFFYAEETFSWPRFALSSCLECYVESSSQFCMAHYCAVARSLDSKTEEEFELAMNAIRKKHLHQMDMAKQFHFLESLKCSVVTLFQTAPWTLSCHTIQDTRDSFVVRVNGTVFDVNVSFGKIVETFDSVIPEPDSVVAFSPLFNDRGFFFYAKKDGIVVMQDDIFEGERKVCGRIVPKGAENVQLFMIAEGTVCCYWTIGTSHYMTNLKSFAY